MSSTFGDQPGDVVTSSRGDVLNGVSLSLYPTRVDAVAGTGLLATVSTNLLGRWSYTHATLTVVWVRTLDGQVYAVEDPTVTAAGALAAAAASAASAALSAALVGAPADTAVAAIVGNPASATRVSLSSTYAPAAVVAAPTGVSATDCANFATAHTSLPASGGKIVLQRGTYDFTAGVTITKPCVIEGAGAPDANWTNCPTLIVCTSATATPITIAAYGVSLREFGVKYTGGSVPTAGAGISVTSAGGHGARYVDIAVYGFWINMDVAWGFEWFMRGCLFMNPVKYGLRLNGTTMLDFAVSDCQFIAGPTHNCDALVMMGQAGGAKFTACKWNQRTGGKAAVCIDVLVPDGVGNEDFSLQGSSLEGFTVAAVRFQPAGTTGTYGNVQIIGNEMASDGTAGAFGVQVVGNLAGFVKRLVISSNVFLGVQAIVLSYCTRADIGTNTYDIGTCSYPYVQTTNCLTVQQGAGWVGNTASANVDATESTSSQYPSWVDLTTVGPSATADIGPSRKCLVIISAEILAPTGGTAYMTPIFTGPSWTSSPITGWGVMSTAPGWTRVTSTHLVTAADTFNEGTETFTAKYCAEGGTGAASFRRRQITVIPL